MAHVQNWSTKPIAGIPRHEEPTIHRPAVDAVDQSDPVDVTLEALRSRQTRDISVKAVGLLLPVWRKSAHGFPERHTMWTREDISVCTTFQQIPGYDAHESEGLQSRSD